MIKVTFEVSICSCFLANAPPSMITPSNAAPSNATSTKHYQQWAEQKQEKGLDVAKDQNEGVRDVTPRQLDIRGESANS